ncbi:uncharacterized protein LOC106644825 [Copidosoma floridanum]|uniref:uncharacterized protein LOC106644825 n=1 Tax=Copidosoma floridanum TaxID=29053 RepID=UPI0006C94814|nr:uncharacterized protein LOC106644825 [Copidosoma floridanum]XP_014215986.1 uncharacterized protein LOC106644825 [Copidosoma floridanum]
MQHSYTPPQLHLHDMDKQTSSVLEVAAPTRSSDALLSDTFDKSTTIASSAETDKVQVAVVEEVEKRSISSSSSSSSDEMIGDDVQEDDDDEEAEPTMHQPMKTAVPRTHPPKQPPVLDCRPIVLATHLVPSLPVGLFDVVAEAIEVATGKPVVLLHESRTDRPVAKDVVDIAILPAGESWEDGKLLPVSFVFEHRLNKTFSPDVYADVVVATDRAPHVEDIMDLRGHRCALPDRRRKIGASTLLFNHLRAKGEGPAFFGNTLDANSQVSALQMVAGKQVEVCVLESPVIKYYRKSLPGVYSLHILSSLGPLPPYPVMVNKNIPDEIIEKITDYLLGLCRDTEWMEKFGLYSVLGFAEYSKSNVEVQNIKSMPTSVPYY